MHFSVTWPLLCGAEIWQEKPVSCACCGGLSGVGGCPHIHSLAEESTGLSVYLVSGEGCLILLLQSWESWYTVLSFLFVLLLTQVEFSMWTGASYVCVCIYYVRSCLCSHLLLFSLVNDQTILNLETKISLCNLDGKYSWRNGNLDTDAVQFGEIIEINNVECRAALTPMPQCVNA